MTPPVRLDYAELYRVVAESATDAIVTIDSTGIVVSVNPAAERMFGFTARELAGQHISVVIPERLRAGHRRGMERYLASGTRSMDWSDIRVPVLTKSGAEIPASISFGDFLTGGQRMFSWIFRDLSAEAAAERERIAATELLQDQATELEVQAEESQALAEELEEANEELRVTLEETPADAGRAVAVRRGQDTGRARGGARDGARPPDLRSRRLALGDGASRVPRSTR